MLVTIRPADAEMGMYVQGFEGTWLSHPFWRPRFVIRTQADLDRIRASDVAIVIDTEKGAAPALAAASAGSDVVPAPVRPAAFAALRRAAEEATLPPPPPAKPVRRVTAPAAFGKADRTRAAIVANRSAKAVARLFDDCRAGQGISIAAALDVVDDIARSLDISSAAFITVTRLRSKDNATYMHSVAVSGLMIGFARDLALPPDEVSLYGLAGLMHDIGKLSIDSAILQKEGPLAEHEMAEIRRHPQLGHDLLRTESDSTPLVMDVCLHHHERMDGSGYPFGLAGDDISRAARVAAICDVYDALVSVRSYKKGMSGSAAMATMEDMAGHFDPDLLFRFMRSAGYYTAGKLVKLRSNRLAMVLPLTREDSRTVVRAFYSTTESRFVDYEDAVLSDRLSDEQAIAQESPDDWFAADWTAMAEQIRAGRYPAICPTPKP
jgi:HD-GYP domain-containing protein (c-di-GMP phosphodiesterase class II)